MTVSQIGAVLHRTDAEVKISLARALIMNPDMLLVRKTGVGNVVRTFCMSC